MKMKEMRCSKDKNYSDTFFQDNILELDEDVPF